jgi:hypothetical protein
MAQCERMGLDGRAFFAFAWGRLSTCAWRAMNGANVARGSERLGLLSVCGPGAFPALNEPTGKTYVATDQLRHSGRRDQ